MSEHMTHAYDHCPRCKSGQIEATKLMYGESRWAVEYLRCGNCGLDFEQRYQYVNTVGDWDDVSYERLREKYYITKDDMATMNALRRKWAFDDLMAELNSGCHEDIELTDEQIESILDEYLERRVYDRGDNELSIESEDMWDSIHKVVGHPEE